MSDCQFQYTSYHYQFDTCIITCWFYSYAVNQDDVGLLNTIKYLSMAVRAKVLG